MFIHVIIPKTGMLMVICIVYKIAKNCTNCEQILNHFLQFSLLTNGRMQCNISLYSRLGTICMLNSIYIHWGQGWG